MHLRCADGILVLLGRTRSLLATRALMPLVSSRGDAGTIVVDAPSAALLPVLRFLALCGEDGVLPVGTWTQVARCVRSIEALSSAAALAARCRLPTLADRLLRWRSLASHWTCPAQRFTIDLVLARSSASSADSLVITAHAAAATVDSFVQLAQQIGKADAERLALQSIESRRRDPAQRTVMLPLARFEASSVLYCAADRPPDAASRAASPFAGSLSPLAPVDTAHSSLAVWCAYIDTTRQAGSVTCPAIFPSGMLERARAAIATTEPLQTRADLAAALDRYERLCAHGACQPDNAFHLHAVLLASGRTCAAAAAVLHDAVARSPAALCRLLDAEAKLAPYVAHPRHQDNRAAPAAPSPRIRIESLLADLVVARLGGHFACDVGARIEQALRKYYSGALTLN